MRNIKKLVLIFLITIVFSIGVFGPKIYSNLSKEEILDKSTDIVEEIKDPKIVEEPPIEVVEEPTSSTINILAVGDIMFHAPQNKAAYDEVTGTYNYIDTFKHVRKYIEKAHIAMANFESVTSIGEPPTGYPTFNSPKETLEALKEIGFDILSTANNHSLDKGEKGIIDTINTINEYGMKSIGTSKDESPSYIIHEVEGIKLGFLSYTYGLNGLESRLTKEKLAYMVNIIDEEKIKADIDSLRSQGVEMVVAYMHWGSEYAKTPSDYQTNLGEKLIDLGVDIIFGSHPHVIQNSQIITKDDKDKFIIYSLGNFVSNQRKETMGNSYAEDGLMVNLEIVKNFHSNEVSIQKIEYIPTWVYKHDTNGKVQYEIIPVVEYMEGGIDIIVSDAIGSRIERSYKDTMEVLSKNSEFQELN